MIFQEKLESSSSQQNRNCFAILLPLKPQKKHHQCASARHRSAVETRGGYKSGCFQAAVIVVEGEEGRGGGRKGIKSAPTLWLTRIYEITKDFFFFFFSFFYIMR